MSDDPAALEAAVRRALRGTGITAAAVGATASIAGAATGPLGGAAVAFRTIAGLGVGMAAAGFVLVLGSVLSARRMHVLAGGWTTGARRIGRVLAGAPETLTPDQADRARRLRVLQPAMLLTLLAGTPVVSLGIALTLAAAGLAGPRPDPGLLVVAGAALVLALGSAAPPVVLSLLLRRRRRADAAVPEPDREGADSR